jgi:phage tail-like protein
MAHDFAFIPSTDKTRGGALARLYVVGLEGNQAHAFEVSAGGHQLGLEPVEEYFPMRLFGGRALVATDDGAWYDHGEGWVKLLAQKRPRYAEEGELQSPIFDSGEPDCVWHRITLDGCIPPGTAVDVWTRASDDWRELTRSEWLSPAERRALGATDDALAELAFPEAELAPWHAEPSPYRRGDGSELPYVSGEGNDGRGTYELLIQHSRGRYLQVRLSLRGDGRTTPRLRALRVWAPRFSYLDHYLPAVYRDDAQSASFLDRFLANVEGIFTTIEDRIAAAQILFDVESAPAEALGWLGEWLGVALDPAWEDDRRRLFIRHATDFFATRGTIAGLQRALRLALDERIDDRLFEAPLGGARRSAPVRIVERFRTRRTPRALLGDVGTAVPTPQPLAATARWRPALGGADLHRRYREAFALPATAEFPLTGTGAAPGWSAFAQETLGFVPAVGSAERARWQRFLRARHASIAALNAAHGSAWPALSAVRLPADEPAPAGLASDWRAFLAGAARRERRLWQDFLARRYRSASGLRAAWGKKWSTFASVALPDRVPADGAPLADWVQFEGTVLAMHRTAHRFTVMLPIPPGLRADTPKQQRRLALARRVLDLEKPAHTAYDMRFYWAMFRLGEARLGDDTLVDLGSRSPELMAPMVLGEGYLSEAFLAADPGREAPARLQIGRDRVGRSARLGGP